MITMKEWMELVDYRITEGSDFGWQCYGSNAYHLDSWNGIQDTGGFSFCIIFDTKDQTVYEVQVHDYTNQRAYRMINPDFKKKMKKESKRRNVERNQAWDDVDYVDLEVDDDFFQKSLSIKAGEKYDNRVSVPLELKDEEMFELMKMAHARDMTLNLFIEGMLREYIKQAESGDFDEEDIL
jgi:hypothetical protein